MTSIRRTADASPPIQASEHFRLIRRRLLDSLDGDGKPGARTILVTSALAGEGKSFIALNLALSLSSSGDVPVTLVDGDWYRSGLSVHFGMATAPGLAELLADERLPAERLLRTTAAPRLFFLPSGQPARLGGDPMSNRRLAPRVEELERHNGQGGITIVDTPPALAKAEAALWAECVGRVVIVAVRHRTPKPLVHQTLSLVQACPRIDCIVNMAEAEQLSHGGYD
jgi:Mrp family chromosome partitioning ATPase